MPARFVRRAAQGLGITLFLALSGGVSADPVAQAPGALRELGASTEVERVAERVIASRDNQRRPFVIIDKANAKVFVFDAAGRPKGADAALLGMARGDRSADDIGARKVDAIGPEERVTPAGRFLAYLDRDALGQEILLIDYDAAIALHAVVKGTADERRAERLASATSEDNRISFGCINVPLKFYREVVSPAFARTSGYVYILPETGDPAVVFESSGGQ